MDDPTARDDLIRETADDAAVAADLGRIIGPLRRAVLRAARTAEGLPDLSEAQIQVLRALAVRAPQASGELAAALKLARPTVSNVIRTMTAAGLVTRVSGVEDLRQVLIDPTPHARDLLRRYDAASNAILSETLAGVDPERRAVLARALPILDELTEALNSRTVDETSAPRSTA